MLCSKSSIYFPSFCFQFWYQLNEVRFKRLFSQILNANRMCRLESIGHSDIFCDHVNFSHAGNPVYACVFRSHFKVEN